MRTNLPYAGILPALMLAAFSSFASPHPNNPAGTPGVIYGLSNTNPIELASHKQFYVQAGAFKHAKNANNLKKKLLKKYHQPVTVKPAGKYYLVIIGPMSASAVKALSGTMELRAPIIRQTNSTLPMQVRTPVRQTTSVEPIVLDHVDIMGALGVANLRGGDGYLGVTSSETDRLVQTNRNSWGPLAAQLGVGYVYYSDDYNPLSGEAQWITAIEPQINAYYLGLSDIKGDVWRFGSPAFNDMTYKMPIDSYRLMLDGALTIVSLKQYSLYVKGGVGNAWNRVGYSDTDVNGIPCANQFLNLNSSTQSNFAWEVGAGLFYAINNRASLSLEYLYADLGRVNTPGTGFTGGITAPVLVPASFRLTSQSALLGLHMAI